MKNAFFSILLCVANFIYAQENLVGIIKNEENSLSGTINEGKDKYTIYTTGINTNLSDVGATFFKNKYIMFSSRKTGAIARF